MRRGHRGRRGCLVTDRTRGGGGLAIPSIPSRGCYVAYDSTLSIKTWFIYHLASLNCVVGTARCANPTNRDVEISRWVCVDVSFAPLIFRPPKPTAPVSSQTAVKNRG